MQQQIPYTTLSMLEELWAIFQQSLNRQRGHIMDAKEKLIYLVKEYIKGNYDTNTFCDQFTLVYDIETDYEVLTEQENVLFSQITQYTSRFSQYEEDLKIPNMYYNEKDVSDKVKEVARALNLEDVQS